MLCTFLEAGAAIISWSINGGNWAVAGKDDQMSSGEEDWSESNNGRQRMERSALIRDTSNDTAWRSLNRHEAETDAESLSCSISS